MSTKDQGQSRENSVRQVQCITSQAEPHMPGTRNCYSVFGPIDPISDGTRSYGSQSLCTSHGTAGQRHNAVVDQGQRQLLEAGQSGKPEADRRE